MKIAFISNHPAPYRDAFLSRLAKMPDFNVSFFSLFPNDAGHAFWLLQPPGYDALVLSQYSESRWKLLGRLLLRFVFTSQYDLIVWPGIFSFYLKIPILLCALFGRKYAFVADSVKQPPIGRFGFFVKKFIVRHAAFIFVPGEAGVEFFVKTFGMVPQRVVKGAYALDGQQIESKIDSLRQSRNEIRMKYALKPDDVVFLMVANMIKTRHYPITSSAFLTFSRQAPNARFVMVGSGPELEQMRALAIKHGNIRVMPGCSFSEMLALYAASDVYVHGGTEPASTALVIGAIAKLPLISSPAVGCSHDVVFDGKTGLMVKDYLNVNEWAVAFERMIALRNRWKDMGRAGRQASVAIDVDVAVRDFVKVLKNALAEPANV